ncbi:meiosis-specific transcription factor ndt80 [Sporothrix eucalyptigena]|uniref:Meiosis-specific transcription factor ndt80 n=1 Tax=Sporothrix eucalyptigena TaxID=1812306 RepID=A0ABP0D4U8_9PEZI
MDSGSYVGGKPQNPPMMETASFGTLQYGPGAGQRVALDINGTIEGFHFDKEWTCYRRNYFSCTCSVAVSPHYPVSGITFIQNNGTRNSVQGFFMSISAVISDNDNHTIELVQYTSKRNKGPNAPPEKVHLTPKPPQPADHITDTEHTFNRIQFRKATNNKCLATQQYFHLLVELWAEVGAPGSSGRHSVKVAHRKSARVVVRGRSPGCYPSERRGRTNSGPRGSAGSLGGYGSSHIGPDVTPASTMMHMYGNAYDPSPGYYGTTSRQNHAPQRGDHDTALPYISPSAIGGSSHQER